jgi:hypothetical protein
MSATSKSAHALCVSCGNSVSTGTILAGGIICPQCANDRRELVALSLKWASGEATECDVERIKELERAQNPISADVRNMLHEPTNEEIAQFIKEFDEGKHPLSRKESDALATAGFRQYMRARLMADDLATVLDLIVRDGQGSVFLLEQAQRALIRYRDGRQA